MWKDTVSTWTRNSIKLLLQFALSWHQSASLWLVGFIYIFSNIIDLQIDEEILRENKNQSIILTWPTAGQCGVVSQALELDVHQIIPYLIQHTFAGHILYTRRSARHQGTRRVMSVVQNQLQFQLIRELCWWDVQDPVSGTQRKVTVSSTWDRHGASQRQWCFPWVLQDE